MCFSPYSDQFSKTNNLTFLDLHFLHPRGAETKLSVIFRYSRTFLQMSQPHEGFWVLWNVDNGDLNRPVSNIRTCQTHL